MPGFLASVAAPNWALRSVAENETTVTFSVTGEGGGTVAHLGWRPIDPMTPQLNPERTVK